MDLKRRERRRERLARDVLVEPMARTRTIRRARLDRLESCLGRLGERERMVVLLITRSQAVSKQHLAQELSHSAKLVHVVRRRNSRLTSLDS